ncbi:thioredoxin family protein [Sphingobacterium sp. SGR-19]|uniref:thioredoxin family protein n=1 Tax=Sphingobacterium sp. SGR-19 TaxID=2710886 RepID=UPI0013E9FF41|nr:thioredoxin family protein [Sphingobacterium sp. SGR-19]NGM66126.1 thioredoxin family protein [Sphingobacterium sp. SGR-19]
MIRHIAIITLCLLGSFSFAQQRDTVDWLSFEELSDSLAIKPKKVLLFFHTDWCAYCRKMERDVFTDREIVNELNQHYYAVKFDAESADTVYFDGQIITNEVKQKRMGQYHDIAKLLATRNGQFTFPTTLILDSDFTVQQRFFQYLDRKKLLNVLSTGK